MRAEYIYIRNYTLNNAASNKRSKINYTKTKENVYTS